MKSYKVRFWAIKANKRTDKKTGKTRVVSHTVRWTVAGQQKSQTHANKAQAETFLSDLRQAAKNGEAFDTETGLPDSMAAPVEHRRTWLAFAQAYTLAYWTDAAAKTRDSLTDALATVTPALVRDDAPDPPDARLVRAALRSVAFVPADRRAKVTPELADALRWLERYSLPMPELVNADTAQKALSALGKKMDGTKAATTTYARKRAVFFGALQYAVDAGEIAENPLTKVRAKRRKGRRKTSSVKAVDGRTLVNPRQARDLLTAMTYVGWSVGPKLRAFFGCMYYGGLRPEEVGGLREADCNLRRELADVPPDAWGSLTLAETRPEAGSRWTDSGKTHDERGLKHRDDDETRTVPIPGDLVRLLREHIDAFGTADDGRLFRTRTGNPYSYSTLCRTLKQARRYAFPPEKQASPLADNPYALRHAAISTQLNGGVSPQNVAARAGNSEKMVLDVYAGSLDGDTERMNKLIDAVLNADYD